MAAYAGIDNFDSYSAGALGTNNGGSGWAGAWSGTGSTVETSVFLSSPNGISVAHANDPGNARVLSSSVDSGDIYVATRLSSLDNTSYQYFYIADATTYGVFFGYNQSVGGTTKLNYLATSGYVTLTTPTANTWYIVNIHFVSSTQYQIRWKAVGGSWSAYTTTDTYRNSVSNPDRISINGGNAGATTYYFDSIGTTDPDPTSSIKTVDGLAKASVKTVNGLAIASVKTIDGLA